MDNSKLGAARDLYESAELAGLQCDLRHANHEFRRHRPSELHSRIFRCVRPGCRNWSNHCQWKWISVAAIYLRGIRSLFGDIRMSVLEKSQLQSRHGTVCPVANRLPDVWIVHAG